MSSGRCGSPDKLQELADWFVSWTWPLSEADSIALVRAFGWSTISEDLGNSEIYETGLLSDRSWASVGMLDGSVREVRVFTSVAVAGESLDDQRFVTDTFADQVEVVTRLVGPATKSSPGQSGSATWDLPNGSELEVRRSARACSWTLSSPYYTELRRDVRRMGG